MRVDDLMTTNVITLNENDSLDFARVEMALARVRHLPVVRGGRLVGLVTHRDILRAMCSAFAEVDEGEQSDLLQTIPVREIMSTGVTTVAPDEEAGEAGRLLLDSKFGCLPVVAGGDHLVGIITEADFVELAIQHLDMLERDDHEEQEDFVEQEDGW